jgi:hypothetical protein
MGLTRRSLLSLLSASALEAQSPLTALAPDGRFLLYNKPTFPLALYQLPNLPGGKSAALRAAKEAGFHIVHTPATKAALDEIAAHQLHAWTTVGSIAPNPAQTNRQRIAAIVNQLKTHPALLYWETEDEPSFQWNKPGPRITPAVIRDTYAYLKQLDPTRLVYLNHSPTNLVSTLQSYNPGGDIIATDVYPIIPHGIRPQYALWADGRQGDLLNSFPSQTGQYTAKMRQVAGPQRAVFMVLQAFAWEMLRKPNDRDPKMILYPTAAQLQFMALQSIIHGANGLVWWGLQFTPAESPLWNNLSAVTKLLNRLQPELAASPLAPPIQLEDHDTGHSLDRGIEWIAKPSANQLLFIAVNADPNPIDVTISGLPGAGAIQAIAGETPQRTATAWRVKLPPFGTCVWKLGR